jgi:hypothetical protein
MTAVEWLIEQISSSKYFYNLMEEIESRSTTVQPNAILQQAKEMEKQQIMNAVDLPKEKRWYDAKLYNSSGEQYYNETFKKN